MPIYDLDDVTKGCSPEDDRKRFTHLIEWCKHSNNCSNLKIELQKRNMNTLQGTTCFEIYNINPSNESAIRKEVLDYFPNTKIYNNDKKHIFVMMNDEQNMLEGSEYILKMNEISNRQTPKISFLMIIFSLIIFTGSAYYVFF